MSFRNCYDETTALLSMKISAEKRKDTFSWQFNQVLILIMIVEILHMKAHLKFYNISENQFFSKKSIFSFTLPLNLFLVPFLKLVVTYGICYS